MLIKSKSPDGKTRFVGNMADILFVVQDCKQQMIDRHGPEGGLQAFRQLKAKDVLDRYAIDAGSAIH
jgi:hypothetical protein